MLTSTRLQTESRIRGYDWLTSELKRVREAARSEALRLLGPDRGE